MKLSLVLTPQKATFAPLLFADDMEYGIKRAAELGYDGIELNIRDPTKIDQNRVIDLITLYDLQIVSFGTGQAYLEEGLYLANADSKIRKKTIERLKEHIRFANKVGAQVVIGGIRGKLSQDQKLRRAGYKGALKAIQICADFANDYGVVLTIEPINRYETNFINTIKEGLAFLREVNNEQVKLMVDTYHMNIEEKSFIKALNLVGELLSHVHLVDSNRLAPGCGHIDFHSILRTLNEIGYKGYLSAEILPYPNDETAAKLNVEHVRKLLSETTKMKKTDRRC